MRFLTFKSGAARGVGVQTQTGEVRGLLAGERDYPGSLDALVGRGEEALRAAGKALSVARVFDGGDRVAAAAAGGAEDNLHRPELFRPCGGGRIPDADLPQRIRSVQFHLDRASGSVAAPARIRSARLRSRTGCSDRQGRAGASAKQAALSHVIGATRCSTILDSGLPNENPTVDRRQEFRRHRFIWTIIWSRDEEMPSSGSRPARARRLSPMAALIAGRLDVESDFRRGHADLAAQRGVYPATRRSVGDRYPGGRRLYPQAAGVHEIRRRLRGGGGRRRGYAGKPRRGRPCVRRIAARTLPRLRKAGV